MTATVLGRDRAELRHRVRTLLARRGEEPDAEAFLSRAGPDWFAGTIPDVAERIGELERARVRRVYLQRVLHDDLDIVRLAGQELMARVA